MSQQALDQHAQTPDRRAGTLDYPPPGEELSGNWLQLLRVFGPGAVIASVTVGTGETIFAPRLGALFGYALLWVVVAAVTFKAVQVYTGARYLVLTGEHPMRAWARQPGLRGWFPALMIVTAVLPFPLWIALLTDAISSLCVWIAGAQSAPAWQRPLWGTGVIILTMMLTLIQTYNVIERVSTVILALKLLLIVLAVAFIRPDLAATFAGIFVPHVPDYPQWAALNYPELANRTPWLEIAVLMGTAGGGVQDYIGYVGLLREKRWGAAREEMGRDDDHPPRLSPDPGVVERGRRWLRAPALDTIFSFGSVALITLCFMTLGAAVLHPHGLVPTDADLYSKQSQFLSLIHPQLVNVYKAGVFFAIFGVIYGAFEIYTRTADEALRAVWPRRGWRLASVRRLVVLYSGLGGLLVLWSGSTTVRLATLIAPFTGVLGCGLWCFAMLWVERTQLPRPYRMRRWLFALTAVAGIMMTAIGGYVTARAWSEALRAWVRF